MVPLFYVTAAVVVLATLMAITRISAIHGLLYLVASLIGIAVILFLLGAPFAAALEAIIYAGAIVVFFVFVVMLLNPGPEDIRAERTKLRLRQWLAPSLLGLILAAELAFLALHPSRPAALIEPRQVGLALYGQYIIGVELASFLLMSGLVGAYHLGRKISRRQEARDGSNIPGSRAGSSRSPLRAGPERDRSAA